MIIDRDSTMANPSPHSSPELRWPPERFYWSIVEGAVPGGSGWADPDTVGALAEADVPIESPNSESPKLHAVYARLDATRVLVCAVERSWLDEVPRDALSLAPNSLPAFFTDHDAIDASSLNLLVGPYEPREVRRLRSTRRVISTLGMLAATALLCVTLARHAEALRAQAKNARGEAINVAHEALGHPTIEPPLAALSDELDRRRLAGARPTRSTPDAAIALEQVLAVWPRGCTPTMLAIAPDAITANVVVEDRRLLDGLVAPSGFEPTPPRLSRAERGTAVALRWARVPRSPGEPAEEAP